LGCFALRDSQAARTKQREPSSGQVKQRAEEQRGSSSHYARRWKARNARGAHMESLARVSARCVNEKCLETEKEKCIRQDSVGNLLVPISGYSVTQCFSRLARLRASRARLMAACHFRSHFSNIGPAISRNPVRQLPSVTVEELSSIFGLARTRKLRWRREHFDVGAAGGEQLGATNGFACGLIR
jgi:hypothetical protein